MKKTRLKNYARLIAKCGVNVQKGQDVFISAGLDIKSKKVAQWLDDEFEK